VSAGESNATGLARYLRVVGAFVRGPVGIVLILAVFFVSSLIGRRVGLPIAGSYLLLLGSYCALNFWHCRETHCVITGPGWTAAGVFGLAAALVPGKLLSWFSVATLSSITIAVFLAGCCMEWAVAGKTGRRRLG
jgi:hypothetical protein